MKAIIIGATGATGKDLTELLLADSKFGQVDIFVRKSPNIQNEKLKIHTINFDKPEEWQHLVNGDVLFSCLGTTLKAAGSKEEQKKVDFYYQLQFAKIAKTNNVNSLVLVSSDYASSSSPFFYSKIKGQLEDEVKKLQFPKLIIFKPPLLERANSDRKAEVATMKVFRFFNSLGLFKIMQPLSTKHLAEAMIKAYGNFENGEYILKGQEIRKFLHKS